MAAFRDALERGEPLPTQELVRHGGPEPLRVRRVPPVPRGYTSLSHAPLRRTSPVAHHAVAAALEALGPDAAGLPSNSLHLGIVLCVMSGCVNYSRRFYDETLKDPATASPLIFPETVFNAPASHLASVLGTTGINYTIVGDPSTVLQGLALAADWLTSGRVDGCLVIGAEEVDWLTAEAIKLFDAKAQISEGAGALYLRREPRPGTAIQLRAVTNCHLFTKHQTRGQAAQRARGDLNPNGATHLLCDGLQGAPRMDHDEAAAWQDWTGGRFSIKMVMGEGLVAAAAWQCLAAVEALRQDKFSAATVSVVGCNQQAIAAQFARV